MNETINWGEMRVLDFVGDYLKKTLWGTNKNRLLFLTPFAGQQTLVQLHLLECTLGHKAQMA